MEVWEAPGGNVQPAERSKGADKRQAEALKNFIEDRFRPGQFTLDELEEPFIEYRFLTDPAMPVDEGVFFKAVAQLIEDKVISSDKDGNYRLNASA